jgi:hydrogenase small subunit
MKGRGFMQISRRKFLKWAAASAAVLGLSPYDLLRLEEALAAASSPPVIWFQGSSCTGCSVAALNVVQPATIDDILINRVSLKYHPTLMAAGGELAIQAMDQAAAGTVGHFILVVEGGVPTAGNGNYCIIGERSGVPVTMLEAVNTLGPKAKHVLAVGTCSSYKGVPGAGSNYTGIMSVKTVLTGKAANPVINVPGCPAPPESVFGVIVTLLAGKSVPLDVQGRPKAFYGDKIHSLCFRRGTGSAPILGTETGCFKDFGCTGPGTNQNCPSRRWNNGRNWCISSGQICIGCSNSTFPVTPMFKFGSYA